MKKKRFITSSTGEGVQVEFKPDPKLKKDLEKDGLEVEFKIDDGLLHPPPDSTNPSPLA